MTAAPLTRSVPEPPRPVSWLPAYGALALIWGASFLFIKVGVREIHPAYVTMIRCGSGALTLLVLVLVTRRRLPRFGPVYGYLALLALLGNVIPFTLFGYGELKVSSIVAGIWNATTPLMVLLVALAFLPDERPSARKVTGLIIGFVGVLVVLGVWKGTGDGELLGQAACAGAAVCYGVSISATRRVMARAPTAGVALPAIQLSLATLELAVIAPILAGAPPVPSALSLDVIASVLALGALGTGVAFALSYGLIAKLGAAATSSVTYVIPIVATALGFLVLKEKMHWYEPVGAVVILLGVALSQGLLRLPGRRPSPALATPPP